MNTHPCPVPGGDRDVPAGQLMCRRHWHTVPESLRSALYRAWRDGKGMGTAEHVAAMQACIKAADSTLKCS